MLNPNVGKGKYSGLTAEKKNTILLPRPLPSEGGEK